MADKIDKKRYEEFMKTVDPVEFQIMTNQNFWFQSECEKFGVNCENSEAERWAALWIVNLRKHGITRSTEVFRDMKNELRNNLKLISGNISETISKNISKTIAKQELRA